MTFPFELGDKRLHRFIAFWESMRNSSGDIPTWDAAEASRSIPELMSNIVMLDVIDRPAVLVRQAGTAYRDHFGVDVTGSDMLEHTAPDLMDARFRRFKGVVAQPCGAIAVGTMIGAYGISVLSDSVWLPVRLPQSGETIVVIFHSLGGQKEYDESTPDIVPVTDKFTFIDIGFGMPSWFDEPSFWSMLKKSISNLFR